MCLSQTQDKDAIKEVDGEKAHDYTLRVDPWPCNNPASDDQVLVNTI